MKILILIIIVYAAGLWLAHDNDKRNPDGTLKREYTPAERELIDKENKAEENGDL